MPTREITLPGMSICNLEFSMKGLVWYSWTHVQREGPMQSAPSVRQSHIYLKNGSKDLLHEVTGP